MAHAARSLTLAFHAIEAIRRVSGSHCRLCGAPRDIPLLDACGQAQYCISDAGVLERRHRLCHCITEFAVVEVAFASEADEQHARCRDARQLMQHEHRARLAFHITALEYCGQLTARCAIERRAGWRELARL